MNEERIAILAGDGILPEIIANRLSDKDLLSLVIVLQGTAERFNPHKDIVSETAPGRINKIRNLLLKNKINKAIMIGKIDKNGFIERKGFDLKALQLVKRIKDGKDLSIFHLILEEFKDIGVDVLPQDTYLKEMIVDNGVLTKRKPASREMDDAIFGIEHAKKMATMEIGQTVVVKNQTILAVEAVEGTSEAIKRGTSLCGKDSVVCKAARAKQDRRFDIPAIGLDTLKIMAENGSRLLALEAKKILMVDDEKVLEFANKKKMSIIGVE